MTEADVKTFETMDEVPAGAVEVMPARGYKGSALFWYAHVIAYSLALLALSFYALMSAVIFVPGIEVAAIVDFVETSTADLSESILPALLTTPTALGVAFAVNVVFWTPWAIFHLHRSWRYATSEEILAVVTERGVSHLPIEVLIEYGQLGVVEEGSGT